nr:dTMP kinase [Actinocatenispora rupis]
MKAVLRFRAFRRLWIVLGFSSIGDWLGILATGTFASSLFKNPVAQGAAFSGTIVVRLIPALVLGPIAGVFADRFDRRRTMVVCDAARFVLYASIPIVGTFATTVMTATWAAIATFLIETCQMMWAPAKEASVPNLVPKARLEKANQLGMATTYGVTPILAGLVLALLNWLIGAMGFGSSYKVALFLNALTYAATALMVWFGIREISGRRDKAPEKADQGMFRQFVDGWRYIARFPFARGLVLGIFGAFAAAGVVVGTGRFYAKSLGGGDASFFLLFALLFVGLGIGITAGPKLVGALSRRRWFGLSIILATGAVGLLALAPHLMIACLLTVVVGAGAGMAFLNGITLLGAEIDDAMRGRVYSFIQVSVQGVLLLTLSLSSVLVGIGSSRHIGPISISSTRILLLAAGVVGVFAGYAALKQMDDKRGVPLLPDIWSSIRGRPLGRPVPHPGPGVFVVFEGGEGAGKSTQVIKLAAWLRVHGREAVVTREPGATEVGARIRGLVLDKDALPTGSRVSPRAEALLYAADRAHHVATVVRPALERGAAVVSDRYVDSSLAYQGAGRTLPAEEIGWLSNWATGGLRPDLVVLLDVDPHVGLARVADRGSADRLESESLEFHDRVRHAFLDLAAEDPSRYLVLDASEDPDTIAGKVRERIGRLLPADPEHPAESTTPGTPPEPTPAPADETDPAVRPGISIRRLGSTAHERHPDGGHDGETPQATAVLPAASTDDATEVRPAGADEATLVKADADVAAPVADATAASTANGADSAASPDADESTAPAAGPGDTTVLPAADTDATSVLPADTTSAVPADDSKPPAGDGNAPADRRAPADRTSVLPAVGADGTKVLPAVDADGGDKPSERSDPTTVMPALRPAVDPWNTTAETKMFPTVPEHAVPDRYDDDETMIMPSGGGDLRRRKPRRRR